MKSEITDLICVYFAQIWKLVLIFTIKYKLSLNLLNVIIKTINECQLPLKKYALPKKGPFL